MDACAEFIALPPLFKFTRAQFYKYTFGQFDFQRTNRLLKVREKKRGRLRKNKTIQDNE